MSQLRFEIRPLQLREIDDAVALVAAAWPQNQECFRDEVSSLLSEREVVLAGAFLSSRENLAGGPLIGVGLLSPEQLDFYTWALSWGAVLPEYQRCGVGTQIVQMLCAEAQRLQALRRERNPTLELACIVKVSTTSPLLFAKIGFHSILQFGNAKMHHHMAKDFGVEEV